MSQKQRRLMRFSSNVLYALVATFLSCLVFLFLINFVYTNAEQEGFENLHMQTKQIKEDIKLQILSDRENLSTIASFASNLYENGGDFSLVFDAFKSIGLIENVGILLPDNTFVTKAGKLDLNGKISFGVEVEKREYTSGRVVDITNPDIELVRNSVPIVSDGKIVGILYGIMELDALKDRYSDIVEELDAQLYVYETGNGNFIIDTYHDDLGNISELKNFEYKDGFSYEQLIESENGYSAFYSKNLDEYLCIHYADLGIGDWRIMLGRPEKSVLESAHYTATRLFFAFFIMVLIIFMYIIFIFRYEGSKSDIAVCASSVRKLLLDINQQPGNIEEALKQVAEFSRARSAIFVDTDGDDYNYIMPSVAHNLLSGEDRIYLISNLFKFVTENNRVSGVSVGGVSIVVNDRLKKAKPELYDFLKKNKINRICIVAADDKNGRISIIGAINPTKAPAVRKLLNDIAVCFSISINNQKYLNKTETIASTDGLTGLLNRVTYNRDIAMFNELKPDKFTCLYIDVNELHYHNNKYGHAAGDKMLVYIANSLKEVFYGHRIYRMGGDEYLVFAKDISQDVISEKIGELISMLKLENYNVAIGMSYREKNMNTEELVKEAEVKMYEAKARYYQNKEFLRVSSNSNDFDYIATGNDAVDSLIKCLNEHYYGICHVSLENDDPKFIMMPKYLGFTEEDKSFSEFLKKYINETVSPDYRRAMLSFVNYDALRSQLAEGSVLKINYKKVSGEDVVLSVHAVNDKCEGCCETLWVFGKA